MRKRIRILRIALLLVVLLMLCTVSAHAGIIHTDKASSLTLQYRHSGQVYEGLEIRTYRVARVNEYGTFYLTPKFQSYPVRLNNVTTQSEWRAIASTLSGYAASDSISPDCTGTTSSSGVVSFENIQPGLYLTLAVRAESTTEVTIFENFITAVPRPTGNGTYTYDITAYPKCSSQPVTTETLEYKVIKLWRDAENQDARPASIQVHIIQNGSIVDTQTLSSENSWTYSWTAPDDGSIWHVTEASIPEGYTITSDSNGNTFILTNTWEPDKEPEVPPTPPKEPDKPETPDVPDTPDKPDKPDDSDLIDNPDTPGVPGGNIFEEEDDEEDDNMEGTGEKNPSGGHSSQPKTGDTTQFWPYILAMALSGSMLLLLAIWLMRRED